MERVVQLGFSVIEVTINVTYAVSIIKLLQVKSSVRQRRVLLGLVYVNMIAITLDILNIILVYVNRTGISHPIQTFSYSMKLRLEFIVLNQLMAVAARGLRTETFEEKRYHHHPSISDSDWNIGTSLKKGGTDGSLGEGVESKPSDATTTVPALIFLTATGSSATSDNNKKKLPSLPSLSDDGSPKMSFTQLVPRKDRARKMLRGHGGVPIKAKRKRNGLRRNDEDEPEEEEIGLHMWERRGTQVLEVPRFRRPAGA